MLNEATDSLVLLSVTVIPCACTEIAWGWAEIWPQDGV